MRDVTMQPVRAVLFIGWLSFFAVAVLVAPGTARAVDLVVTGTTPARHTEAPATTTITIDFDRAVAPATITPSSFRVFGRWTGPATGASALSDGDSRLSFTPDNPFSAGEYVFVTLSHDIEAADGSPLRSAGYAYQFRIDVKPSSLVYAQIATMTTRTTPGTATRAYSLVASDLNHDGYLDITSINEVSSDVRVFLNKADGSATFDPFLSPHPIGLEASPNEPADFNADGHVDVAVAAGTDGAVWIMLGNGDGTFGATQRMPVGSAPHGIAVLDADGDGDTDIVNTNFAGNNLSVLINDGTGIFGPPTFFEGGVTGEWALGAGDMNNDGIFDIVAAAQTGEQAVVHLGNGDGTFTQSTPEDCGGRAWQLMLGDVNGDGDLDVSMGNSGSNNGAILLGNGDGTLTLSQVMPSPPFILATDLGDLDGDGDLDWVLSAFSGGKWTVYTNDGSGHFTFNQEFDAPQSGSCAVPMDMDNDGDLDLALTDELADVVITMRNVDAGGLCGGVVCDPETDCSGAEACNPATGLCEAGIPEPDGSACTDEGDICTDDECDGAGGCRHIFDPTHDPSCATACDLAPQAGCLSAERSLLQIKDNDDDAKDRIRWKWTKGDDYQQGVLGDPLASTTYELCIYDSSGSAATLISTLLVEAGPAWLDKDPKGWDYKDKLGASDGTQQVQLRTGVEGKSKAQLKARGDSLPMPSAVSALQFFIQESVVTVQLVNDLGTCWTSEFTPSQTKKNTPEQFKAIAK